MKSYIVYPFSDQTTSCKQVHHTNHVHVIMWTDKPTDNLVITFLDSSAAKNWCRRPHQSET